MELIALWKMFKRRWWIMALPALAALVIVVPDILRPVTVSWTTVINLTAAQTPSGDEPTYEDASFVPWTASEYLVHGLADWIRTGSFAGEVSSLLAEEGQTIDAGAIRGAMASDNTRSVLRLYISWPDAEQLQAIAEAAVEVLQTRNQAYFPQLAGGPVEVVALDGIGLAPVSPGLLDRLRPLIKVAIALLAGIAVAAVVEYIDDSIYSREDLEALDLAVIGVIPRRRRWF